MSSNKCSEEQAVPLALTLTTQHSQADWVKIADLKVIIAILNSKIHFFFSVPFNMLQS